jgi:hypothetical protein
LEFRQVQEVLIFICKDNDGATEAHLKLGMLCRRMGHGAILKVLGVFPIDSTRQQVLEALERGTGAHVLEIYSNIHNCAASRTIDSLDSR